VYCREILHGILIGYKIEALQPMISFSPPYTPLASATQALQQDGFTGQVKVLTSCPSCLQGLSRFNDDSGTTADYIVVEMARHLLGENWMADFVKNANSGGIERVLV
jgi:hypothetical protein